MNLINTRRVLGLTAAALSLSAAIAGCSPKPDASDTSGGTASTAASPTVQTEPAGNVAGPPTPPPGAGATTSTAPVAASGADNTAVPDSTTIDGKKVTLKKTASGLRYYDTKEGTGAAAKSGQTASVQYTGTLLDGTKFDSSYDHGGSPFDFPLGGGQVIRGWDEGVVGMKIGGKRRLVVPGDLAYGPNPPTPTIPPNATLVFDVELVGTK